MFKNTNNSIMDFRPCGLHSPNDMGIDYENAEFGNDCACYAAGRTPAVLWVSLTGISRCISGGPIQPPPPNNIFRLEQDAGDACFWKSTNPTWQIEFRSRPASSLVAIIRGTFHQAFGGNNVNPCIFSFTSPQTCNVPPIPPFYAGGSAVIMASNNAPYPSLQDYAGLLNLIGDDESMAEFWPVNSDSIVLRYARTKSPTNILMKVKPSEFP